MSAPGMPPRIAAANLLHAVLHDGRLLSDLLNARDNAVKDLPPNEHARAQSLVLNVLRHLEPIDIVLDQFLQKSPPLKARNALRLATAEMLIDNVAPHAAVDAAVRLVRLSKKTQHMAGLTNAVARRVSEHGPEIWQDLDPQSLPNWLAKPLDNAYGVEARKAIEAAHAKGAPLDLTLKDQSKAKELADALGAEILPTGSLRIQNAKQVSKMAGYDSGDWWVQDTAAALPAKLLGDVAGKSVLDLCAAPGGKTMQLSAGGANVTALDVSKHRLKRVTENLTRTNLSAQMVAADATKWEPDAKFDAILLDAPCSATGTIRRHPDLPFAKTGEMKSLLTLQRTLLKRAFEWLKPSGKLVYCTCSLLPAEGEQQINDFLEEHTNAKLCDASQILTSLPAEWVNKTGSLRLRPDFLQEIGGMDGFYAGLIEKV